MHDRQQTSETGPTRESDLVASTLPARTYTPEPVVHTLRALISSYASERKKDGAGTKVFIDSIVQQLLSTKEEAPLTQALTRDDFLAEQLGGSRYFVPWIPLVSAADMQQCELAHIFHAISSREGRNEGEVGP